MGWSNWYVVKILVIVGAAIAISIDGVHGDATVSGMVFCDQCKDDHISLFDYPLHGIKVLMACPGQDGHLRVVGEETTNWLGGYVMQFEGASDLSSCRTQVADSGQGCGAVAGPAQRLKLIFEFFDTEMYTVDPLLSQPAQPMSFCRRSPSPVPTPVTPAPPLPPPAGPPPVYHPPPTPRLPSLPPPAAPQLPPLPSMPPMPSLPFLEASACPYWMWTLPEHECYWRVLSPDMKVAVVFGPLAAKKYGTDITLRQSMNGRGDPYRTLLREGTTALLNSYNSIQFPFHPLSVVLRLNMALMDGSTRQVLMTGLRFLRANSGQFENVTCKFTSCD